MDLPGCRTFAFDLPNFGKSESLDIADIDVYAEYLAAFIEKMSIEKAVIVGHSLGGGVVMSMAARRAELAAALVLVDSVSPDGIKIPEVYYPNIEMYITNRDLIRTGLIAMTPTMNNDTLLDALTKRRHVNGWPCVRRQRECTESFQL